MKSMNLFWKVLVVSMFSMLATAAFAQPGDCYIEPGEYCSFTPGGWGQECNGNNVGCIRDEHFVHVFPGGVSIGIGFTASWSSAAAVQAFLPAGGTPGVFSQDYTDATVIAEAGVFAGQLLAATLNMHFAAAGYTGGEFDSLWFNCGQFDGWPIDSLILIANQVIGGNLTVLPEGVTVSDISDALSAFNEAFVDCEMTDTCFVENPDCLIECPDFEYTEVDQGDLAACDYPTLSLNPAHGLSGIAWLGACVTGELMPFGVNEDECDDGVNFMGLPWTPCTAVQVQVTVTAGPNYQDYLDCGGELFLSGWKDGNLDGDFCDVLCGGTASEWIVQDVPVTPGTYTFTFIDPGVFDMGVYDGVFRWRLMSGAQGAEGFGLALGECGDGCGTFALDSLGEVEDYIIDDAQLDVELSSFDVIPGHNSVILRWTTASEVNNDRFEIRRNGSLVQSLASQGNSAAGHSYEWVDRNVQLGTVYDYTLTAVDANGHRELLGNAEAAPGLNGVVTEYALYQNYPNPFNPSTSIRFDVPEAGHVMLQVFDLNGRAIATLVDGNLAANSYEVSFDATSIPSGTYFYRIQAGDFTALRKMLILK